MMSLCMTFRYKGMASFYHFYDFDSTSVYVQIKSSFNSNYNPPPVSVEESVNMLGEMKATHNFFSFLFMTKFSYEFANPFVLHILVNMPHPNR